MLATAVTPPRRAYRLEKNMGFLRREVRGGLGDPVDHGIPTIPEAWKFPTLVMVVVVCAVIFIAAVVYGLHHS
jgi:hypothetical protein